MGGCSFKIVVILGSTKTIEAIPPHAGGKLMILLLDGFRWDYFTEDLEGFQRIFRSGVKAEYLQPDFPTVSYTNYYTIMTGLHAESHGMVGNYMYDERRDEYFLIGGNPAQYHAHWWDGGDPVWITAQRQGRSSYMYYWPGCEVQIQGLRPTSCQPYDGPPTWDNITRAIDESLTLLQNHTADMTAIYFENTDKYGHKYGPDSEELREVIVQLDHVMSDLQRRLDTTLLAGSATPLSQVLNLVIVSDHGMIERFNNKTVNITQYIDINDLQRYVSNGPSMYLWPEEDKVDEVYSALRGVSPHLSVYKKADLPERWHLKNHYRVAPITLLVEPPWSLLRINASSLDTVNRSLIEGDHGYDNNLEEMRGIFVASGPYFRKGLSHAGLHAVEVYQLLCDIVGIAASPHNGTWTTVADMIHAHHSCAGVLHCTAGILLPIFICIKVLL